LQHGRLGGKARYIGIPIPSWDRKASILSAPLKARPYCDEVEGIARRAGLAVTELSTHLQGQWWRAIPAFDTLLEASPPELAGNAKGPRSAWAVQQLRWQAQSKS